MVDRAKSGSDQDAATAPAGVDALVTELGSREGVRRHRARIALVEIGQPAVEPLKAALQAASATVRWEAAKALGQIGDPDAAPALIEALRDPDSSVRWLAAKALIALGCKALEPLLSALQRQPESVWLREGAHHVLHALRRQDLVDRVVPVVTALRGLVPTIEVPWEAKAALDEFAESQPCEKE